MIYYVLSAQIHLDPTLTQQWGNETHFRHKDLHTKYEISAKQRCDIKRALALTGLQYQVNTSKFLFGYIQEKCGFSNRC